VRVSICGEWRALSEELALTICPFDI
jgi:hypothetical protein